ncbi:hypothetical protein ACHAW6_010628, partial [Cyclotella cf. meneghiniana]
LLGLGNKATLAHVILLAHSSFLSIKQLCDNGCHAVFTKKDCKWEQATQPQDSEFLKSKLIQFLHQCAFSPPPSTWIKAINNNQFSSSGLTANAAQKHLPKSTATAKGHMKKTRSGIQSTCPKPPAIRLPVPPNVTIPLNENIRLIPANNENDFFPTQQFIGVNHIFFWAALANLIDGTSYMDLTGRFRTMSLENQQYIFVAYDYTTNAIISATIINAFDDIFSYLKSKGFKPKFNVLNNEASAAITEYLLNNNIKGQFVPPNEHCDNAAELAIQTVKNHFISGLCTTDCHFPSHLWDKLLWQAQDSLNMFCTSILTPLNQPTKY